MFIQGAGLMSEGEGGGGTLMRSKSMSPSRLGGRLKILRFLKTWGSTSTVFKYRIESFPRKSKVTLLGGSNVICSNRREQQPTVSASSSPFSFPARKANISMRYIAVARCLVSVNSSFKSRV